MSRHKKRFDFLEHTADLYIAAYGKSLEEAFENAALAMFESMTDLDNVKPETEDLIEVEGQDEQALLYSWLEELLMKLDVAGNIYCRFNVVSIKKIHDGYNLKARIWGEPFNPKKHFSKVGVKAVTYHKMEIVKKKDGVTVRFLLDI